jgi:hypothetical protein
MLHIYANVSGVFHMYIASVLSKMFAYVCNGYTRIFKFFSFFASVSDVCCKCFSCFRCMLQVFHLNVVKVDRMLHMLQ